MNRLAQISIMVSDYSSVEKLNHLLSEYGSYIIGRMGLPIRDRGISIISIVLEGPNDIISALSGKIGMLPGVSSKTLMNKEG